ncbi:MAG: Fpg/Nei family DNA glycosylase [Pirellulales bacterium]|nr:Fpg/Nei family DNA glycosylase [Pirellulales bacterium]
MPELPEVETMRRCIEPVTGCHIRDLRQPRSRLRPIKILPRLSDFRRRVVGRRIVSVGRLGKRVVVALDQRDPSPGDRIIFEPRMSGLVLLADPPNQEHVRLVFELSGKRARRLLFWNQRGLGVVRLVSPRLCARLYGPDRLGPDALTIDPEVLRERLQSSRRAIKVALLDQRALAGIGNLYASEILHRVRLHPETRCTDLRPIQWKRLHAAMGEVLEEAICHQGSTLRDGTYRVARNRPGAYQICHRVYQRAGEPCLQCGKADIARIVQAQRSTFFCPFCQKR